VNSKELINLMLSPQWTAKLLFHFVVGAQRISPNGIKTELLYLALPFLIDDVTRRNIKGNIKSSFFSTFIKNQSINDSELLKLRNALHNKNRQTKEYGDYTNRALIYLGNITEIETGKHTKVKSTIQYQDELESIRSYCKAAHYLGVIFAKEDHHNIFLKLGIMNI
jgi:hypothetical protein